MRAQIIVVAMSVVCFIGCGGEEGASIGKQSFATTTWFGGLSQSQRNLYILYSAADFVQNQSGHRCNCKEWARDVVRDTSNYQANIPSTCPNPSGWYWCLPHKDVQQIWYIPYAYPIYAAVPGNIVQMQGPHTAIITYNNMSTVCFTEANYTPCTATSGRCQSINSFIASKPNHMVYEVIGH